MNDLIISCLLLRFTMGYLGIVDMIPSDSLPLLSIMFQ